MKKFIDLLALVFFLLPCVVLSQSSPSVALTPTPDLDKLVPGVDCLRGHVEVIFKHKHTGADVVRVIALIKTLGVPKHICDIPNLTYDVKLKENVSIKMAVLTMIKDPAVSKCEPDYVDNGK